MFVMLTVRNAFLEPFFSIQEFGIEEFLILRSW